MRFFVRQKNIFFLNFNVRFKHSQTLTNAHKYSLPSLDFSPKEPIRNMKNNDRTPFHSQTARPINGGLEEGRDRGEGEDDESDPWLSAYPECVRTHPCRCLTISFALLFIASLMMVIMIPLSFHYVEKDEIALKKNTVSNEVALDRAYTNGRYGWGLAREPLVFPRGNQRQVMTLDIFPSNGLEFKIEVQFYWRIDPAHLVDLFRKFPKSYPGQVASRANSQSKNTAPSFSIEEFKTQREKIRGALYDSVVASLFELHVIVPRHLFLLTSVSLPDQIKQKDLDTAVQFQDNIREQNKQQAELVRKETQRQEQTHSRERYDDS